MALCEWYSLLTENENTYLDPEGICGERAVAFVVGQLSRMAEGGMMEFTGIAILNSCGEHAEQQERLTGAPSLDIETGDFYRMGIMRTFEDLQVRAAFGK